ncbi:3-hydroxyanthranilate 3,4-dioxygenase [Flavobacterium sp. N1719]|uniref:3-hydroxyanthranilate 3,4-dioxygenase n=1 Tax=Flavobacterium sp. N1719 TaxID=2885633 RepID=UPI0022223F5B|nr:3-hydroxyanthranilate 3,4-dioxygenase [Flavobacterium sp. N1719]
MATAKPFNLKQWIEDNKHLLQPPVANKNLYVDSGDYIVMIVGGPNARNDFHYNETEELFYQLEGNITVYIQEDGEKKAMPLGPGDLFLLPAKVPHSPSRTEGSVGLVIERKRENQGYRDGLLWFCNQCNHKLHEVYFELHNIETDFLPHFNHYYESEALRTCSQCGTVMETKPGFIKK